MVYYNFILVSLNFIQTYVTFSNKKKKYFPSITSSFKNKKKFQKYHDTRCTTKKLTFLNIAGDVTN
jgi:hypothetical protein